MADRRIKIRWATSRFILGRIDGIRVRIDAVCSSNMPARVFAYRMLPTDPATGAQAGWFSHVCSPTDIEEFPANSPIPGHLPEWYRLDYVDIFLRSREEADAFITDVRSDVRRLKTTLDIMDSIETEGAVNIGGEIICTSSSSLSELSSSSPSVSSLSLGSYILRATGTFEQGVGYGQPWVHVGTGAGSPVGSSDSLGANYSQIDLIPQTYSQMLLIQGFPFANLPDDAILDGIEARLVTRWLGAPSSSSSSSSVSGSPPVWNPPRLFYFRLYHPELGAVGDDQSNNTPIPGSDWTTMLFGSPTALWNADLTVEAIKRGGFGVAIIVGNFASAAPHTIDVDGVELSLHYRG